MGKVKAIDLGDQGKAVATVELDERYAPIPEDTRAMLRQKTLLGETYVELTPGSDESGFLPEDGALPEAQVAQSVQLDEIFRTFDEPTRVAFQQWMQNQAIAFAGRGTDLSAALAELDPFAEEVTRLLRTLDTQRLAVRQLFRNGGEVFAALSERPGQLRGLIENSNTVFQTTARRNRDLQAAFEAFPTFLDESRLTLTRLDQFAENTDPLVKQLRPAVQELGPTAVDLARLAPHLERLWVGLRRSIGAREGLTDLARLLRTDLPPVLERLPGYLNELDPILRLLKRYKRELAAFVANSAAATQGINPVTGRHALRTTPPLNPESVASFPSRPVNNRTNPYVKPGGYLKVRKGLKSFETRQCTGGLDAELNPSVITDPAFEARVHDEDEPPDGITDEAEELYVRILRFAFGDNDATAADTVTTADVPAPRCVAQAPLRSIGKTMPEFTRFLHVYRQGAS